MFRVGLSVGGRVRLGSMFRGRIRVRVRVRVSGRIKFVVSV